MPPVELSKEELTLARANLAYAIENCPVEGGVTTEDGRFSSRESFESLQRKLHAIEPNTSNRLDLDPEDLGFLIAAAKFAHEYCPIEGMLTEDGRFPTREDFGALLEKLKLYNTASIQ